MDFLRQPMQGSDIAAFVFAVLALLFWVLSRRGHDRGTTWLAIAYALLTVQYALNNMSLPVDGRGHPMALVMFGLAGAAMNCGLMYYLASPLNPNRWLLALAVAPPLLMPLSYMLGLALQRPWSHLPYVIGLCIVIKSALDAAQREPKAGHTWLALSMLFIPASMLVSIIMSVDPFYVRYYVMLPVIFFGIMLLTVSMLRRSNALEAENERRLQAEHALMALNASLETTIASRTADLQNIVAGLESFNRNVSHDLQGSLGGMAGLARVAQDALRPEGGDINVARRVLPLLVNEAERSTALVGALLTLARVGDQALIKTVVDLNALIHEVIASMALITPAAALPRFIVGELPPVHADIGLLRPALTNLISNAVKSCGYRPEGCVDVRARADVKANETIIQVRDNGIGFSSDTAGTMFQPFTRLHGDDFAGHGVGLSIVRRAIERQGGRVWAESTSGSGASFYLSLPDRPK